VNYDYYTPNALSPSQNIMGICYGTHIAKNNHADVNERVDREEKQQHKRNKKERENYLKTLFEKTNNRNNDMCLS
jgi:hypothetical protein